MESNKTTKSSFTVCIEKANPKKDVDAFFYKSPRNRSFEVKVSPLTPGSNTDLPRFISLKESKNQYSQSCQRFRFLENKDKDDEKKSIQAIKETRRKSKFSVNILPIIPKANTKNSTNF